VTGELVHADAQDPRDGQRVGQAWIDPAALEVDQPALGTTDQVGQAGLREATPQPVGANLFTDRRSHCWMLLGTHPGARRRTRRGQCAPSWRIPRRGQPVISEDRGWT
jgi:hypothetical protein